VRNDAPDEVVFVSSQSPHLETVRSLCVAHGWKFLTVPQVNVPFAIVDLTTPQGAADLERLRHTAPSALRLAIAEPSLSVEDSIVDTLAPRSIETELIPRLVRLKARSTGIWDANRRQRDLTVLLQLTGRYSEVNDIGEMLHDMTRRLAEEMSIDRAALVVVDSERGVGTVVASSDDASLQNLRIELSRYPEIREAVRTQKPVILEEASSHPLLEDVKETVRATGIRNIAALPLLVSGRTLGVMLLKRFEGGGAFTMREVEFLTAVAHATAIAFRNLKVLESIRGQTEIEKSARIQAEERAAALRQYESYFEHLSDGVAILDEHARCLSLNPAGARLLDVAASESVGQHVNALTNPIDENLLLDILLSVSKGAVRSSVDLGVKTGRGRKMTLSVSAAPLSGEGTDGIAILTMRDVTKQRAIADELRQTKEFLERLVDSSVDAVIAANMHGVVILFNKAAEAIFGFSAPDIIGQMHVTQLYADPALPFELMKKLRSAEYGGVGRLNTVRAEIVSRHKERIPVDMTASIIFEGTREVATVGIFTDLRARLNLERKLSDVEMRLIESEKTAVVVALAGTTAHELNQPLTSVMGYAELLKRKIKDDDPLARPVDIIYRESERMAEIVRKIGKITRFETKPYIGSARIIDLNKAASHED
jgi:PAS domain S-box-containing protein